MVIIFLRGDLWEEKLTSGIDPKAGTEKKNRELLMTWLEPVLIRIMLSNLNSMIKYFAVIEI